MTNNPGGRPEDQNGRRRTVLDSFRDALRGVWGCVKSERNMRIHLVVCAYVLFFAYRLSLSRGEMACLVLTIGCVMSAEAMNTAVEKLCDFTQKHLNPRIRVVKDMAAGAVFLCALAAALVGVVILFRPELWTSFLAIVTDPASCAVFLVILALALAFIILGPRERKEK